jgi:hypothetical protein
VGFNRVRQTEMHGAEPLLSELSVCVGAVFVIECVQILALYYCHTFCDLPHVKFNTRKRNNQLAQHCFTGSILLVDCFRRTYSKYLSLAQPLTAVSTRSISWG